MIIKVNYTVSDIFMSTSVSPVYIKVVYSGTTSGGAGVWGAITGTLSNQTDLQSALDLKVPTSRTITINGVSQDLSANRTYTIDALPSQTGNSGKYLTTNGTIASWGVISTDNIYTANGTLTSARTLTSGGFALTFTGSNTAATAIARGLNLTHTLVAAANSDVLVGLDINPTFTNGAFTGVTNYAIRSSGTIYGNTTGYSFIMKSSSGIRTDAASGGTMYIDGDAATTGTINLRSTTLNIQGTTNAQQINSVGLLASSSGTIIESRATIIASLRLNNTTSATTWYFENHRNAPSGSLEITNSLSNAGLTMFSTRNVGIGTNTDAGFKLDVNGTARVSGIVTFSGQYLNIGTSLNFGATSDGQNYSATGTGLLCVHQISTNANRPAFVLYGGFLAATSGTTNLFGFYQFAISPTSGNATFNFLNISTTSGNRADINTTGTYSGIIRGFYFNPTLTSTTGATIRAIETEVGDVLLGTTSGSLGVGVNTTINASAIVDITSTTKGFLPPRMTTTQINAIATPAEGLMAFNTTISHLCVYQAGAWVKINHSPM
jgi:hypothetical protein